MADATYQPGVYHRQGGDNLIIASGGTERVESGGVVDFESGAVLQLTTGASLYFDSSTYAVTAAQLKNMLWATPNPTTYAQASVSVVNVILPSQMSYGTKFIMLSMTSNLTTGTVWLPAGALPGMELFIKINPGSVQSGQVTISCSGCSLVTLAGSDQSRAIFFNSTNSRGMMHLACFTANEWTVISISSATSVTFT